MSATHFRSGGSPHKTSNGISHEISQRFSKDRRSRSEDVARRLSGIAAPLSAQGVRAETSGRAAATWMVPAGIGLLALATVAWVAGCSARRGETASSKDKDQDCSQTAACTSAPTTAATDGSTEGGGPGSGDQASDLSSMPTVGGPAATGGAASKPESSGTGRATRDRRGLVDAWPEVHSSSRTSRPVPGSPMASAL